MDKKLVLAVYEEADGLNVHIDGDRLTIGQALFAALSVAAGVCANDKEHAKAMVDEIHAKAIMLIEKGEVNVRD